MHIVNDIVMDIVMNIEINIVFGMESKESMGSDGAAAPQLISGCPWMIMSTCAVVHTFQDHNFLRDSASAKYHPNR